MYKSPNPGANTGKKRLLNPHAEKYRPGAAAAPRKAKPGLATDNSLPVNREKIRTEGGAAKLKPGQRKKAAFKVPPMRPENPFC